MLGAVQQDVLRVRAANPPDVVAIYVALAALTRLTALHDRR